MNSRSLTLTRCYRTRTTADKREIKDFPKLPSATSFIRKTLDEMLARHLFHFLPTYIPYPQYSKRFLGTGGLSFMCLLKAGLLMYRDNILYNTLEKSLKPNCLILLMYSLRRLIL